ncbi:MAG TPA: hypothetical protein ENK05_13415 [Gammaproteobacteria bacterium]|nr:hypothetical protein [Gammaproteobacteria bacterium]
MNRPLSATFLRTLPAAILLLLTLAIHTGTAAAVAAESSIAGPPPVEDDVIARVGDQDIHFAQLNTMLNSSAIVGLSVPALGTTERNRVRITLLDKMISANLLYLDALQQGLDRDPQYQDEVARFSEALLASLYRSRYLIGELDVSEQEIQDFYHDSIAPGTELTDAVHMAIEAKLRKQKLAQRQATLRQRLREDVSLEIRDGIMDASLDPQRKDGDVVATIDGEPLLWKEIRPVIEAVDRKQALMEDGLGIDTTKDRFEAINRVVDNRILARKARTRGLDRDPLYLGRLSEFRKTRLINLHRKRLLTRFQPDDRQIEEWYAANGERIRTPETRKIQMVVLKTREQAERMKQRIEAGELTIYQAARDHSIDPNAKKTLGEMGWVAKGSGFPALDELTFRLRPDELGGPVESPAGWHLVTVLDVRDARNTDIADAATRKTVRRLLLREALDRYVVDLRRNHFQVSVYDDRLNRLFRQESEWVNRLAEKAGQPGSMTRKRVEEMKKFMAQ